MRTQYFEFGQVLTTPRVNTELSMDEVLQLLKWHGELKQGELCDSDYLLNKDALHSKQRIFSSYRLNGEKYYVITEWDRSITTVLTPDEY